MTEYKSFHTLKGIACIIVVFLHCNFPGFLGRFIAYFMRFPVPIFFMISGFFSANKPLNWYKKKIWQTLKLIAIAEALMAFALYFTEGLPNSISVYEWICELASIGHPLRIMLFGTIFNGTLWYLYAVTWVWIVFYAGKKLEIKIKYTTLFVLSTVLLLMCVFGRLIFQKKYDIEDVIYIFRSFFLQGIPFVVYGRIFKRLEGKISKSQYARSFFVFSVIFGFLLAFLEYKVYKAYLDVYVSTIIITVGLFAFSLANREKIFSRLINHIGKRLSSTVYLIHLPVIVLFEKISSIKKIGGVFTPGYGALHMHPYCGIVILGNR